MYVQVDAAYVCIFPSPHPFILLPLIFQKLSLQISGVIIDHFLSCCPRGEKGSGVCSPWHSFSLPPPPHPQKQVLQLWWGKVQLLAESPSCILCLNPQTYQHNDFLLYELNGKWLLVGFLCVGKLPFLHLYYFENELVA